MFKSEHLQEKWAPVLEHDGLDSIKDNYRKACYRSPARKPRILPEGRSRHPQ